MNVASRFESANKELGTDILVSDAVYQLTQSSVTFGPLHELDLRGKVGMVGAYEVISVDAPIGGSEQ